MCIPNCTSPNMLWSISRRRIRTSNLRKHSFTFLRASLYSTWLGQQSMGVPKYPTGCSMIWWLSRRGVVLSLRPCLSSRGSILQLPHPLSTTSERDLSLWCQMKYPMALCATWVIFQPLVGQSSMPYKQHWCSHSLIGLPLVNRLVLNTRGRGMKATNDLKYLI